MGVIFKTGGYMACYALFVMIAYGLKVDQSTYRLSLIVFSIGSFFFWLGLPYKKNAQ